MIPTHQRQLALTFLLGGAVSGVVVALMSLWLPVWIPLLLLAATALVSVAGLLVVPTAAAPSTAPSPEPPIAEPAAPVPTRPPRPTPELSSAQVGDPQALEHQKLESLGVLAGGIAHDFNNLLMSVLGNTSIALMELEGHPASPALREIEVAAKRARDLVGQLLAYAGKGNVAPAVLDLNQLVREMGDLLSAAVDRRVRVAYAFDDTTALVLADPTQLRQVVMNLITNASDAMHGAPEGVVRLTTHVRHVDPRELRTTQLGEGLQPGPYVVLQVSDSGAGMDRETLARIFDPFYTTKATGRGLGLAAVQGIVRRCRGAMRVDSVPGTGSTFTLYFPYAQAADEDEDLPTDHTSTAVGWRTSGRPDLLVIDDDPVVLKVTVRMAERLGFHVHQADCGSAGIEAFRNHHAALAAVLVDMTMPDMTGLDTMKQLRQIADVPVILTSGYAENEIPALEGGLFLQKPYTLKQLTKALDQASEA